MEIKASASILFLSLFKILQWGIRFYNNYVFPCVYYSLTNISKCSFTKLNLWRMRTKLCNTKIVDTSPLEKLNDGEICLEEMKIVMDRLGISCQEEDIEENWVAGVSDFSEMLVDEEPSLLEIKQVFQVFDENRDGFIDASELRRVLCGLCLIKEGSKLEECRKMVCAFDQNEDGLLDFEEFVAFMDKCFH